MRYLKNNHGYTMLIAIVAIVLFAVLGLSLMTLTTNGIAKNQSRVAVVQSKDLSEKGIDFAVTSVQTTLQNALKDSTGKYVLSKEQFEKLLNNTLSNPAIQCPQPLPDVTKTQFGIHFSGAIEQTKTMVCIEKVESFPVDLANPEKDKYKRYVTFKSYGVVNGKYDVTTAKIAVGTDAIPDQLKYAVSSNTGSLYFHGGVKVTGDIKTAKDIYVTKKAFMSDITSPRWYDSVPLEIERATGNATSKLIFNTSEGKFYYYDSGFENGTKFSYSQTNGSNDLTTIKSTLTNSQNTNIVYKSTQTDSIDVANEIKNVRSMTKVTHEIGKSFSNTDTLYNDSFNTVTLYYNCEYKNNSSNTCKTNSFKKTSVKLDQIENLKIQGKYYINGSLEITNSNVKSNAILYVNGDVTIKTSSLEGLNDGSLIIFASGDIKISNISEYLDTPSTIKGFFYSQNNMTLYGVGSNIKIIGGISANNLYLTSLRGKNGLPSEKVTPSNATGKELNNFYNQKFTVNTEYQRTATSRLQIVYDHEIIAHYTKFSRDQEEEFITEINDAEIIERY